jgi:hypothetical protein
MAYTFSVMSSISSAAASLSSSLFSTGSGSNWLADTITNIQNEANQGGLLGMLSAAAAGNDGSTNTFLKNSIATANSFATIAQTSVTNYSSLIAQMASQNLQKASQKKLQEAMSQLSATQQTVQPKNTLDSFVYFGNGSSLDTNSNIMTMSDGTQYDTTTGTKYVDPASIIQMANGAYLDTKNNILTETDGTKIDTVTGLKVAVTGLKVAVTA